MMEHFRIDRLIEYKQEEIDETTKVVNPRYRELESTIRSKTTLLSRQQAKYGTLILETTEWKRKRDSEICPGQGNTKRNDRDFRERD